jgi:hypothetical protein
VDRRRCGGAACDLGGGVVRSVFDAWSDRVFLRALDDSGVPVSGMLWAFLRDAIVSAFVNPANWKRVRLRRDPKTRRQVARVTRALRRSKRGAFGLW